MQMDEARTTSKRLSRRDMLRLLALGGGAALVAACGGTPTGGEATAPTTAPTTGDAAAPTTAPTTGDATAPTTEVAPTVAATGEQVTIEWANRYSTKTTQEIIPAMVAEFEKLYPNIKVNYQNPGNGEGYDESILGRIAAGDAPDVITLYSTPTEFAARGSLLDIDAYMQGAQFAKPDAFFEAPLASCQWQGKTYGLPSSAGAGSLYLNTTKFQEKNLPFARDTFPKTWDELKALSKQFVTIENGEVQQAGYVPFVGNEWLYPAWSALNGGVLYDVGSNSYKLDSDNNVQWLDYWLQWLDEQYGGNFEQLNIAGGWGDVYPDTAFSQGRSAICHSGSWAVTDAEIPFAFEVVRFPVGPSGTKSATAFYPNWWAIPKGAKRPDEAFLFIEFIATKGWETWYTAIMDTPSWKSFPPTVLTTKLITAVGQEKAADFNKFFADYLNDAVPMWNSPIEQFAQQTINTSIGEVLNKVKTPKEALAEAQKVCQAKLEETLKG
jgi:ABC-type glycerol-3-phosphate transport system substrate-binding protein